MFTADYLFVCLVCFVIMLLTIRYALRKGGDGDGGLPEPKAPQPDAPAPTESRRKELA